jgi:hypothetical protein
MRRAQTNQHRALVRKIRVAEEVDPATTIAAIATADARALTALSSIIHAAQR